jgi:hypothetical protein
MVTILAGIGSIGWDKIQDVDHVIEPTGQYSLPDLLALGL